MAGDRSCGATGELARHRGERRSLPCRVRSAGPSAARSGASPWSPGSTVDRRLRERGEGLDRAQLQRVNARVGSRPLAASNSPAAVLPPRPFGQVPSHQPVKRSPGSTGSGRGGRGSGWTTVCGSWCGAPRVSRRPALGKSVVGGLEGAGLHLAALQVLAQLRRQPFSRVTLCCDRSYRRSLIAHARSPAAPARA